MNKHTATAPDGTVLTRNSQNRTYTHMVAARSSYRYAVDCAMEIRDVDRRNFRYWERLVRTDDFSKWDSEESRKELREAVAAYMETVDQGNFTRVVDAAADQYAQDHAWERLAKVNKANSEGHYDRFGSIGWCGSILLAEQLKRRTAQNPHYAEVVIIEVERS
jgi:hypothetical protein